MTLTVMAATIGATLVSDSTAHAQRRARWYNNGYYNGYYNNGWYGNNWYNNGYYGNGWYGNNWYNGWYPGQVGGNIAGSVLNNVTGGMYPGYYNAGLNAAANAAANSNLIPPTNLNAGANSNLSTSLYYGYPRVANYQTYLDPGTRRYYYQDNAGTYYFWNTATNTWLRWD
jgi:hypothetical protein